MPVVILDGKGWGHGVGMAQWGAKYMADTGADVGSILGAFYPGTEFGSAGGAVRVAVYTSPDGTAALQFPGGGELRSPRTGDQSPGFPVAVAPGDTVVVSFDGAAYHVSGGVAAQAFGRAVRYQQQRCIPLVNCPTTTTTAPPGEGGGGGDGCLLRDCSSTTTAPPETTSPPPSETAPPPDSGAPGSTEAPPAGAVAVSSGSPVYAFPSGVTSVPARGRSYRGMVEATAAAGPLRLVNELDVEQYLKGMGEVPASWPAAAIGAQAVVARTYALRAMSIGGELCDYDLCQVYIGATREAAGQNAAVDETAGMVLTYGGKLATTVYSADAGGVTANTFEGFGTPDGAYPYLTTVRYDTPDPLPWRVSVAMSDVAARFSYPGTVTALRVSQTGPSGRALEVVLDGTAGPMAVPGRQFKAALGLRSTLFALQNTTADVAPPPPLDPVPTQALPDDSTAILAAAVKGDPPKSAATADAKDTAFGPTVQPLAADPVRAITDEPAAWIAVAVLGLVTAAAMSRFGLVAASPALLLADRRHPPILAGIGHVIRANSSPSAPRSSPHTPRN